MASKKPSTIRKVSSSSDSRNASTDNDSGNNSGARRKTKTSVTIVKSRYMQTEPKGPAKNSVQQQTTLMPPRPSSPKLGTARKPRGGATSRRTMSALADHDSPPVITSILEASNLGGNVLQSTVLDGHCLRPDFDVSVIKDKVPAPPSAVDIKNEERDIAMETFILAFLTAKIEHKNHKLREEAERNILTVMEKEQQMRSQVYHKKRQYLLMEKQKQLNSLLDLQIESLGSVATAANTFSEEYKSFATAIDATRHKLPVKNVHIGENTGQFLDTAVGCLNQSERVLQQYTQGIPTGSEATAECLGEIKNSAHEISKQMSRTFSELLEVSSLVSRETVLIQQSLEEDQIGQSTAQILFCPTMS